MRGKTGALSGALAGAIMAGTIGCMALAGNSTGQLLTNPSFHILVNNEMAIPESGTFDFDTKLFKVNYTEDIDLAAVDERIVTSLETELGHKGFKRAIENPGLLISYAAAINSSVSGSEFNEAYAEEFPVSVPEPGPDQELNYHQGVVIVDFVDSNSGKLLWRGAIMADVRMDVDASEKDRRMREAIHILLSHFPKPITK
jgi:hypothetical protein